MTACRNISFFCPVESIILFRNTVIGIITLVCLLPGTLAAQENLRLSSNDAGLFDLTIKSVDINYTLLKDADEVNVLIEDFKGQIVDNLVFVELRSGDQKISWKGLDPEGKPYPDGRYRLHIVSHFHDGTTEKETIQLRLVSLKKTTSTSAAPPPLPPQQKGYKIDGSLSTFWRYNSEDPDHKDHEGEQRARIHFMSNTNTQAIDTTFSARKAYSAETSYNGTQAWAEQRWQGGKLKGVFRQSLGKFDDPMQLFNDFRTERNKFGLRAEHHKNWLDIVVLTFDTEGDVDTEERGMAGRMTMSPAKDLKFGMSYTNRNSIPLSQSHRETSSALAFDLQFPITQQTIFLAEIVRTEDITGVHDEGYVIKTKHNSETLQIAAGYFDLGESFGADYANPIRQIRLNGKGVDANLDYRHRTPLWGFRNITLAWRGYLMERHSDGTNIRESDCSLRGHFGHKDSLLLSWLGHHEDDNHFRNVMFSNRHKWNKKWSSTIQVNNNSTDTNESWRYSLDTTLWQQQNSHRLTAELIRRKTKHASDAVVEEASVNYSMSHDGWGLQLNARHTREHSSNNTNLFGRTTYTYELLHRYLFTTYIALGNRSSRNTEEQIELGLEIGF